MPKKKDVKKVSVKKEGLSDDSKTFAFIATFLSIVGFIIAILLWRKDNYVMFYAKQSLVLFVVAVIVGIIRLVLVFLPILGWIIIVALNIMILILWLQSWIYALSGEKKDVALIGGFAKKIDL